MPDTSAPAPQFHFGSFTLSPAERQLLNNGHAVSLGPRAFDVLLMLVQQDGRLVEKNAVLERVWPGLVVEDNTLQAIISTLRKALGKDAIATVSKFGYRFTLQVTAKQSASGGVAHHFPAFQSSFIGRRDEVAALIKLLARARTVTIHGPGGAGKTRLSVETGLAVTHRFSDGAWFMDLTSVQDGDALIRRLANNLGMGVGSDVKVDVVARYLGDRSALLVLDNVEHLVPEVLALVDALLSSCPHLVVLSTSRQPIGSIGEAIFKIPSLSLPSLDEPDAEGAILRSDASRLFIERAKVQKQHFEPDAGMLRAIARICHRLDGMPLSIELAASRVRSMAVDEIDQRLDEALRLLVSQPSDAPRRHRTLRALIEWSYDLLDPEEQKVFRRVSVFSGGFRLEMAEALFADSDIQDWGVLDVLEALVAKSMLVADGAGPGCRYRQLETIRQYAREQLDHTFETAVWTERHLGYFLARVVTSGVATSSDSKIIEDVAREDDNIQTALRTALADARLSSLGLKLCIELYLFWYHRGFIASPRNMLLELLSHQLLISEDDRRVRVKALNAVSVFNRMLRDLDAAVRASEEALLIVREQMDALTTLAVLHNLAGLHLTGNHVARAARGVLDELSLLAGFDAFDSRAAMQALGAAETVTFPESLTPAELRDMSKQLTESLAPPEAQRRLSAVLITLAVMLYLHGDVEQSEHAAEAAVRAAETSGNALATALAKSRLAGIMAGVGKHEPACKLFVEILDFFIEAGLTLHICEALDSLAKVMEKVGDHERSLRLFGAFARLSASSEIPYQSFAGLMEEGGLPEHTSYVRAAAAAVGEERFNMAFQGGYQADLRVIVRELAAQGLS